MLQATNAGKSRIRYFGEGDTDKLRKEADNGLMFSLVVRIYHFIRVLGIAFAVAGTLVRLLEGSMIDQLPVGIRETALQTLHAITSWPVYAVSLLFAGAWLQDWVDARLLKSEGRPSWFGIHALRGRLFFTSWIVGRPRLYADEHKIMRELERVDAALTRAGFATLRGLPLGADEDLGPTKEYLASIRALIGVIGAEKAAGASVAIKERLLPTPNPPEIGHVIVQEETPIADISRTRTFSDILPWPFRRNK